ncbi:MAG: hypothetical protein ABFC24_00565 [Methanoregulaceae archaeon]
MDLICDAVNRLEKAVTGCGYEDGGVILEVNPERVPCQYERGAVMEATFGGMAAEFTTADPMRAATRVSFMFGAPLETAQLRAAASGIMNAVTGFLCMSRKLRACNRECHGACRAGLVAMLAGKTVYCHTKMPALLRETGAVITDDAEKADIILLNGDGMISPEGGEFFSGSSGKRNVLFLGPSTAGVATLEQADHFCPYGTG